MKAKRQSLYLQTIRRVLLDPRFVLLVAGGVIIIVQTIGLWQKIGIYRRLRRSVPYYFPGYKFAGIKDILRGHTYLGYFTDKDLDEKEPARQFSQAQYVLAPHILDVNNPEHTYILLDYSDQKAAMEKIRQLGAIPLKRNNFGIILARKGRP